MPRKPSRLVQVTELMFHLAARQKGLVTRAQLLRGGVSPEAVDYAVAEGRLVVLYRGVYQAGPVLEPWGRELAAVLACRYGALLSHGTAAVLWSLLAPSAGGRIHVTVTGAPRGRHAGIQIHRLGSPLPPADCTVRHGVPVTSPARTLLDLAATVGSAELQRAFESALQDRLVTMGALQDLLARNRRRRGAGRLAALLPAAGDAQVTRSHMERAFLQLVRRYGLPAPATNVGVRGFVVDCYWQDAGLVVELDGYRVHGTRPAFEADRRRNAALLAAGLRVLRLSWRQIDETPERTMVQVGQALVTGRVV
jgi:very-short-patch-repair endonuclease